MKLTHSTANDKALGHLSTSYMSLMHTAHARFGNHTCRPKELHNYDAAVQYS